MITELLDTSNSTETTTIAYSSLATSFDDVDSTLLATITRIWNDSDLETSAETSTPQPQQLDTLNNWWAMLAVILVISTATGNVLVCLAITLERRLQNVTNYFLVRRKMVEKLAFSCMLGA